MMEPARLTRISVATSLVIGAVLTVVSITTMPDFSSDQASRLEALAAAPLATVSALTWVVSQLFILLGVVGVAHLLRPGAPRLAAASAALVGLSCFGHTVYGGVNLVMLSMAADPARIDTHAAVLDRLETGVAIPFMAAGLLGLVLGFVLLAAALWRAQLGPRWLGPALALWIVLEFGLSNMSAWSGHAAVALFVVIFGALALVVWRSSPAHWRTEAEAMKGVPSEAPVPV